jgi:hypothetical protein
MHFSPHSLSSWSPLTLGAQRGQWEFTLALELRPFVSSTPCKVDNPWLLPRSLDSDSSRFLDIPHGTGIWLCTSRFCLPSDFRTSFKKNYPGAWQDVVTNITSILPQFTTAI